MPVWSGQSQGDTRELWEVQWGQRHCGPRVDQPQMVPLCPGPTLMKEQREAAVFPR